MKVNKKEEEVRDELLTGVIAEMGNSDKMNVPFSPRVSDINEITGDDTDPMFVTVEVMNPQVSNNKRRYTADILYDVAKQINDKTPDGYLGHVKPDERGSSFPDPVTLWLGAKVEEIDGKLRLLAKGYIMPDAKKLRSYLKKSVKLGKNVGVSIYGQALQKYNVNDKVYDIRQFVLESIDWSRTGAQGITGQIAPVIASEITDDNMDKKLSEITIEDIKENRPELIEALKEEFKKEAEPTPAPTENPTPAPTETHEMSEILTIVGTDDIKAVPSLIQEMVDEKQILIDALIDAKVSKRVSKGSLQPIYRNMIISEMTDRSIDGIENAIKAVEESEEGKAFISEMVAVKPFSPKSDNRVEAKPTSKMVTKR